jgi:hypothetical protein
MTKIKVHANPYSVLDHKGRLAGALLIAEPRRSTATVPTRQFVGAKLEVVSVETLSNHISPTGERYARGHGMPQGTRTDNEFIFTGEPMEVDASGSMGAFYAHALKDGSIFEAGADGSAPLEKLARARLAAIAQRKAEMGEAPATTDWERQFPLDLEVAEASKLLAEHDKAAAEKAKAEASAAAEKAKTEKESAAAKAKEERTKRVQAAQDAARKALRIQAGVASGLETAGTSGAGAGRGTGGTTTGTGGAGLPPVAGADTATTDPAAATADNTAPVVPGAPARRPSAAPAAPSPAAATTTKKGGSTPQET